MSEQPNKQLRRQTLPANTDAERGLISSILIAPAYAMGICADNEVTALFFHTFTFGLIYGRLQAMFAEGMGVDVVTLTTELHKHGQLAEVGGPGVISELFTFMPTAANCAAYVGTLKEMMQRREVIKVAAESTAKAYNLGEPLEVVMEQFEGNALAIRSAAAIAGGSVTVVACDAVIKQVENRMTGTKEPLGMITGIPAWDSALYGIFPATMIVLGARPKVGKTAMVENMMQTQIETGIPVLCFQKDMSVEIMLGRMACRNAGVCYEDFVCGMLQLGELNRVKSELKKLKKAERLLRIYNPTFLSAIQLGAIVQREIHQNGVKVWYLDHFQHLRYDQRNIVEGLTESSREVRRIVDRTKVSGVVVAQISKDADKQDRPHAGQFKYCDQLFSDADQVVLLWSKDDPQQLNPDERQEIHFTVDANRMGAVSDNKMLFWRERMTFEQCAV